MRAALLGLAFLLIEASIAFGQGTQYTPVQHQFLIGFNAYGRPIGVQPDWSDLTGTPPQPTLPYSAPAHQWINGFNSSFVPQASQPAIADLSDATTLTGSWSTYTPTLGCASGTLTSASATGRFKQVGKTVSFTVQISITTNGSCSGFITFSVPVSPPVILGNGQFSIGSGVETAISGKMLRATYFNSASLGIVANYDGSYAGASGGNLSLSGLYESQ